MRQRLDLDVVRLAAVDSTSTHAATLLAQGRKTPFAVVAAEQTGGRGRRGNLWQSPVGNVYVTFALSLPAAAPKLQSLLPLKAGAAIAEVISRQFGVRLTLKWPNDLLFSGRKVGGLLLEGATSSDRLGDILIGIGLNVESAPTLPPPYQTTSLRQVLGRDVTAQDVGDALLEHFVPVWEALPLAQTLDAYAAYALEPGQPWCTEQGERAELLGLNSDGALNLRPLTAGVNQAPLTLTSADHGWRWQYQFKAPLLVADVGNTAMKIALYDEAAAESVKMLRTFEHQHESSELIAALRQLAAPMPAVPWPLYVVSVNPKATARLAACAEVAGLQVVNVAKRPVRRRASSAYPLLELGADRLAAIEGYLATSGRAAAAKAAPFALIVAAGTATTIDAVAADGTHLGGLILPGLGTALASLHDVASLLPLVDLRQEALGPEPLGQGTRQAMAQGSLTMTLGAVERVQRHLAQRFQAPSKVVVITGGWGGLLARGLGVRFDPELVLHGVRAMALGGWHQAASEI